MNFVLIRLDHTPDDAETAHAYSNLGEFESDLLLLRDSLRANSGRRLADLIFSPLLRKVRTFDFQLSTLDIRQHARQHSQALNELSSASASNSQKSEVTTTFKGIANLKKTYPRARSETM